MTNRIVLPGELLAERPMHLEGAVVEHDKTYATVISTYDDEKGILVPLEGVWYPRRGDIIIGFIEEEKLNSFVVNLNSPYKGIIIAKMVETHIANGDIIEATVKDVDKTNTPILVRVRKLLGGKVLMVKPSKIPRIIGKNDTMLMQLSEGTKSHIIVGRNGIIWMKGGDLALATDAIMRIAEEAHTKGLTNRIKEMLGATNKV